jgi:hypothetical protein
MNPSPYAPLPSLALATALALATTAAQATADHVWWEAEAPVATNFPPAAQNPFAPADAAQAALLSGGAWIGVSGPRPGPLFAEYDVVVPAGGTWNFYVRKFWYHGPFRWQWDDGPWTEVRSGYALMDEVTLRLHTVANWVSLGRVDLAPGTRRLRIELLENDGAAAFDCFVITRAPFQARGALRPGEVYGRAPEGWFPFEPPADSFAESPIDLRHLNEAFAGERGWIRAAGERFVHGDTDQPVRFWAVNSGLSFVRLDDAAIDYCARQLAKYGVNLVRLHGLPAGGEGVGKLELNPHTVARIQYTVAALKREGIYTCLSLYFPLWVRLEEADGFAGYTGQHPFALHFFHPRYQAILREWWRGLLTAPNPYGPPLAQEPAVAQFELVNEDSYFFWTFTPGQNVPWPMMEVLEAEFGAWAARRHGSIAAALAAWNNRRHHRDDPAAGRLGVPAAGELVPNREHPRTRDSARFLAEHQRAWFERERAFLRDQLGYRGLVQSSNWVTADARVLGPLEKWSNAGTDYMDRHGYFGGEHRGDRASYALSAGDTYRERTALRFENARGEPGTAFGLPIADIGYAGQPSIVSEINWTPPGRFRAEYPVLAAVFGALQDQDGIYHFAAGHATWQSTLTKFPVQVPTVMGQFPALARLYRLGLVTEGPVVADLQLTLDDLFALRGAPASAPQNLDDFRARDIPPGAAAALDAVSSIDPLAHYVGRVRIDFVDGAAPSRIVELSPFVNRHERTLRSATGEIHWDWGRGLLSVNAPQAAIVAGFLPPNRASKAGPLVVETTLDYATLALVSLDGAPLATSGRMLLQIMTEDSNHDWRTSGTELKTLESLGVPPLVVRSPVGTVRLDRADATRLRVTALDLHGHPRRDAGTADRLTLRPDTLYYLIER